MKHQKSYRTPRNMGRSSRSDSYNESRGYFDYNRDMGGGEERWGNLEGGGSEPSSFGSYGSEGSRRYPASGSPYSPYARESEYSEFGSREPSRSSYGAEREWRPGYSDESSGSSSRNSYESNRFRSRGEGYMGQYGGQRGAEYQGQSSTNYYSPYGARSGQQFGEDQSYGRYGNYGTQAEYGGGQMGGGSGALYGSEYGNPGYTGQGSTGGGGYYPQQSQYGSERGQYAGRGPKGFKRSDERIKEEVCEMLTRDPSVDAENIEVEVSDGEVTLSGSVPERNMKHMAEDCAERCFGVTDVTNNLRVKRESESSAEQPSSRSSSRRSSSSSTLNS